MRLLFSVEGPRPGQTRRAISSIPFDVVHVFAADPESPEIAQVGRVVGSVNGTFSFEPVARDDLLAAFHVISAGMARRARDARTRACSVNAGSDANLLSAAALLACLHEGVEAHFVHEKGHAVVPVLVPASLSELLAAREKEALRSFPAEGLFVRDIPTREPAALTGLKRRGLILLAGDRLLLTGQGRAFQEHLGRG